MHDTAPEQRRFREAGPRGKCFEVLFSHTQGAVTLLESFTSLNALSIITTSTTCIQRSVLKSLAEDWVRKLPIPQRSTSNFLPTRARHCSLLDFMKHAQYVYAENMVIALIMNLLISNLHSLSRGLPPPACVESTFHPLLRKVFWLSSSSSDLCHPSLQKIACVCLHNKSCGLVLPELPALLGLSTATARLSFQKPADRLFFFCFIRSQTNSLMFLLSLTSVPPLIRPCWSQRTPVSVARANHYLSRAHIW